MLNVGPSLYTQPHHFFISSYRQPYHPSTFPEFLEASIVDGGQEHSWRVPVGRVVRPFMPPFSTAVPLPSCKIIFPRLGVQPQYRPLRAARCDTLHELQLAFGRSHPFKPRFDTPGPGPYTTLLVGNCFRSIHDKLVHLSGAFCRCHMSAPHSTSRRQTTSRLCLSAPRYLLPLYTRRYVRTACAHVTGTRAQSTHELCTIGSRQ